MTPASKAVKELMEPGGEPAEHSSRLFGRSHEVQVVAGSGPSGRRIRPRSLVRLALGAAGERRATRRLVIAGFRQRARRAGVGDVLLDAGSRLEAALSLPETAAYYRLLVQAAAGRRDKVPNILNKFSGDKASPEEFSAILNLAGLDISAVDLATSREEVIAKLAPTIDDEIASTGGSTIFMWLMLHGAYEPGDAELAQYVDRIAESAFDYRHRAEGFQLDLELVGQRERLLQAVVSAEGVDAFACGATVLSNESDQPLRDPFQLEFGTFLSVDDASSLLLRSGLELRSRGDGFVEVALADSSVVASIQCFRKVGGLLCHGTDEVERWHTPFGTVAHVALGRVPADISGYLTERFGNWETPTVFYDDLFDAPNSEFKHNLPALFALSERASVSIANGIRHYADVAAEKVRDLCGVDYTAFMPKPIHRKALSTPYRSQCPDELPVHVIADRFDEVNARTISWIRSLSGPDHRLVVAVLDVDDGLERMANLKVLKAVDYPILYDSLPTLIESLRSLGAVRLFVGPNAGFDPIDADGEQFRVVEYGANEGRGPLVEK